MRRQEELRRLEELRNQELQKRKQIQLRYKNIIVIYVNTHSSCVLLLKFYSAHYEKVVQVGKNKKWSIFE